MRKIILLALTLFFVLCSTQEIPAQVYKYVDKDGVIHFTDNPTDPKYISLMPEKPAPRMSLDCVRLDIRMALKAIGESLGINVLFAHDVLGEVTTRSINVPADKLLREILLKHNLVGIWEKDFILISRPEAEEYFRRGIGSAKRANELSLKIKSLIDASINDKSCAPYRRDAFVEALQIMNSAKITGEGNYVEFLDAMEDFVGAIENKKVYPHTIELLANKARAILGQSAQHRPKPTHIESFPIPPPIVNVPPPVVNIWK